MFFCDQIAFVFIEAPSMAFFKELHTRYVRKLLQAVWMVTVEKRQALCLVCPNVKSRKLKCNIKFLVDKNDLLITIHPESKWYSMIHLH